MATDDKGHTIIADTDEPDFVAAVTDLSSSIRDFVYVADTTARATAATALSPSTSDPLIVWRADAGAGREIEVTTDGSTWRTVPSKTQGWTAYTPMWGATTTNPTKGNGTITGAYTRDGDTIYYRGSVTLGSTTTVGNGIFTYSLPVACAAASNSVIGSALAFGGSTPYNGIAYLTTLSTSTMAVVISNIRQSTASPYTIASGDSVSWNVTYEAAS